MSHALRVVPFSLVTMLLVVGVGMPLPEADRYHWETAVARPEPGFEPVAVARCDRDRDGDPDLAIAYAGDGIGVLVWIPVRASRLGAPEPPLELPFAPTAMVAGDLDADDREELAFALDGVSLLAVMAVAADGELGEPTFHPLPGVAHRLTLEDRPRRDGLPELVVDLGDHRLVAGSARGALAGLLSPRLEALPEAATEASLRDGVRLLLATRIDADASPELVVAAPDGSVRVGTLIRATVVVDTTDDSVDFGGAQQVPDLPGPDGKTTLREAIIAANNTAGPHTIQFNIPQSGNDFHDNAWWFSPSDSNLGPLPAITMTDVTVDGGSQTASQGDTNPNGPELVLHGSGIASGNGLVIGPYCTVLDLVIQGFDPGGAGVQLSDADCAVVKGCYVGTSPDGLSAVGNTYGAMVVNGTTGAQVGGTGTHGTSPEVPDRNLISGNVAEGIHVSDPATTDNTILGNWIGTDSTGTTPLPNQTTRVIVLVGASLTTIGGTGAGATNVIAGNGNTGIDLREGSSGTLIAGNLIGTDPSGLLALPNGEGVAICGGSPGSTVGGTSPAARNLISGNTAGGVRIQDPGTDGTVVQGNWIGLDADGVNALGTGPSVDLGWVDASFDVSSFRLERRVAGGSFAFLTALPADSTSYHDPGPFTAGTTYYYRVRAQASGCVSPWSNVASVTVPGATSAFCRSRLTHFTNAQNPYVEHGDGFFGATWRDCSGGTCTLVYARLDASGAILDGPVEVAPWGDESYGSQLVWNGSEWGHLWFERLADHWGLFFQRLDPSGAPLSGAVRLNTSSELLLPGNGRDRGLAWDGAGWGAVWSGYLGGVVDVYYAHLDGTGDVDVAEVVVSDSSGSEVEPMLQHTGSAFGLVWYDTGGGQFHLRTFAADGTPSAPSVPVTSTAQYLMFPDLVWNGGEYGLVWVDARDGDYAIYITRFDAAGTALSPETRLSDPNIPNVMNINAYDLVLRFLGDRWVVASEDWRDAPTRGETQLSTADLSGAKAGLDVIISGPPDGVLADYPALAWNGSNLLALWHETVGQNALEIHGQATDADGNGSSEVYMSRFNRARGKLGSDLLVSDNARQEVDLLWTGEVFLVAWSDSRTGMPEIHTAAVAADGSLLAPDNQISSNGGGPRYAMLAGDGAARAVVWVDNRDGNWELYGAVLDRYGARVGDERRLTDQPDIQNRPHLAWSGSEYLLVWQDSRNPTMNTIYARRLSPDLAPIGPETQISDRSGTWPACAWGDGTWGVVFNGPGGSWFSEVDVSGSEVGSDRLVYRGAAYPELTHDGNRFVITTTSGMYWNNEAYLTSAPCALDTTDPTCPSDLAGDSQMGATVLTWTPGVDPDFAVDWQRVWLDGTPFAVVEPGVGTWTDPMPTAGIHTYTVTTLNQGGLESTGCAKIAVYASATCIATRDLPDVYGGGAPFTVTIATDLPPSASTHAVEDAPPAGWTVSNISDGGTWDPASQRVKWVFFDNLSRNLTYTVTPPAGTTGTFTFSGVVSVDGGSQAICGDGEVGSGPPHPADVNNDWRMVINEVTGYATAWRTGQTWPEPPNPIPIAYVTNAAYLYLSGELYHYVLGASPLYAPGTESLPVGDGTAWSTFGAMSWAPATPFAVTVQVAPDAATMAWAAEDEPPVGWTVSGISHGGVFDAVNHKVKWGPFLDHTPRALQYTITPTAGSGLRSFAGTASFDGHDVPLAGARAIGRVLGDIDADDDLDRDDHVALRLDLYGVAPAPLPDIDKDGQVDARDLSEEVKALEVVLP